MYACRLRIGEATTLEIRSFDRANQVLRIIGKGDKERLVLLPQPVLDDLSSLWPHLPIAQRSGIQTGGVSPSSRIRLPKRLFLASSRLLNT